MADVFISYDHGDDATASRLAAFLKSLGISVWWDRSILAGNDFSKTIENELMAAKAVIVIWSAASVHSQWVRDEADVARRSGRLVPVHIDGTNPPLGFRQLLSIDLTNWVGQEGGEIQRVLSAIRRLIEQGPSTNEQEPLAADFRTQCKRDLHDHLRADGQKRILLLDGGGTRGIIQLRFLIRLEKTLREVYGNNTVVLSDFFDLISGVSFGTAVGGALALGMSTEDIESYAIESFTALYKRDIKNLISLVSPSRLKKRARERVHNLFGKLTLGSDELRTGLMLFAKRVDTNASWIICNHPASRLYEPPAGISHAIGLKDFLLADLVAATTSMPPMLPGEILRVGESTDGYFVDGFLGPYTSPTLGTFFAVRHPDYGFCWKLGGDNVLMISIGAGGAIRRHPRYRLPRNPNIWTGLKDLYTVGNGIMHDVNEFSVHLMRSMSEGSNGVEADEMLSRISDQKILDQSLMTFHRYDVILEPDWLSRSLGLDYSRRDTAELYDFTNVSRISDLQKIGDLAARNQISASHFEKWLY